MATNKLLWSSKLIGVFSIMLVCALSANAQFLRTSYFMEGTHYRQQLNPALTPTKGYFNLPVIGAVNATVGSTSLGYQDIIAYDPIAMNEFRQKYPDIIIDYAESLTKAYDKSDVLAIVTAWEEFRITPSLGNKKIIDCRYML